MGQQSEKVTLYFEAIEKPIEFSLSLYIRNLISKIKGVNQPQVLYKPKPCLLSLEVALYENDKGIYLLLPPISSIYKYQIRNFEDLIEQLQKAQSESNTFIMSHVSQFKVGIEDPKKVKPEHIDKLNHEAIQELCNSVANNPTLKPFLDALKRFFPKVPELTL